MSDVPEPTGAFKAWLEEDCSSENSRGGKYKTNRDWVMSIWGNPWMINYAQKIFDAGVDNGK